MRERVAIVIVAGALVSIAGCGDDDPITTISTDAASTSTTAGSSEEFIAAADSRCAEANAAIANLSTGTEVSALSAGQQLEITQGLIEGLQSLGPPEDPTGALDRYFAALEDEVALLEEQEAAASGGDTATAVALATEVDAAQSDALAAAAEYGFEECGQEGTTLPETGDPSSPVPSETPVPTTTVAPVEPTPTTPVAPVEPAPAPVTPPAPTGGTGTGEGNGSTGEPPSPGTGGTGGIGPG